MTKHQRILVAVIFAVLFFLANQAFAQSTDSCAEVPPGSGSWWKYRIDAAFNGGTNGPFVYPNSGAACSAAEASWCSTHGGTAACTTGAGWVPFGLASCKTATGFTQPAISRQVVSNPAVNCPADEPPEVECELPAVPEAGVGNFAASEELLDHIACDVASHCLVSKRPGTTTCGASTCAAIFSYTDIGGGGVACDGATVPADDTPPPLADPEQPAPPERCTTDGGAEYCVNTGTEQGNDAQCGFLNDTFICVDATPQNGCQSVGSTGGALCDPAAQTPPAPNSGTPGTVATPDGQVGAEANNGNTVNNYNFFDNDTVTNSTVGVVTGHVNTGNDQDGDGYTDENEEEQPGGTASGGGSCEAAPVCEGDQIQCAILAQEWRARCPETISDADMLEAMGATDEEQQGLEEASGMQEVDVGDLDAGGIFTPTSCPAPLNVTIMGQAISMDIWQAGCQMATWFAPFVMAMGYLLAAWAFVGKGV